MGDGDCSDDGADNGDNDGVNDGDGEFENRTCFFCNSRYHTLKIEYP